MIIDIKDLNGNENVEASYNISKYLITHVIGMHLQL